MMLSNPRRSCDPRHNPHEDFSDCYRLEAEYFIIQRILW